MILYRPVGLQELTLIYDSGMKAFPARLPQQPIFYPVLQLEYARQTASGWNTQNGGFAGYVTQFKVEDDYIGRFEEHTVGESQYQELWIPAEKVEEFNKHIVGHIKVVEAYFGGAFQGFVPEAFGMQGKNAVEQFTLLANSYLYKRMEFYLEIKRNHKAIFLNYPFWLTYAFKNPGLKEKILQAIKEAWLTSFPQTPLPLPPPVQEESPLENQTRAAVHGHSKRLVDPLQEDIPYVEQADSYSFDDPVHEETPPVKRTPAQHWTESVDEDLMPEEQTNAHAYAHAKRVEDLLDEDTASLEQTDSEDWENPVQEDSPPAEQTDSHAPAKQAKYLANPVHEDTPPVKQTGAHVQHWVTPRREETTPPKQTDPHFVQGIKLGLSGEVHEAIDELSQAVEKNPDDGIIHTSLGVAFHQVGEEDRALACYETALKIDPIYAEAHYFRANLLYRRGDVREAIAGYTVAIGLQPELIEAHQKPRPEDRLTDYTGSPAEMVWIAKPAHRILALNKLLESNPEQAHLLKERAAEYDRLRNYAKAIADYTSSLALQPDDSDALHLRGVAYEQLGQQERALEDYQRAIAIHPQISNEYIQRGVTLGQMRNYRQSIASLTEGIRLAPQNPDAYFNRGTSYFQLGDFENAIADFSMAIQLSPKDEDAYYWRGISYEATGRPREAIVDYKQFLAISQNSQAKMEIEQKLSQWNVDKRDSAIDRSVVLDNRQETNQVLSEKPSQKLDIYGLIVALGERALHSTWFGSGVNCYGEKAEELYAFTDHNRPIEGRDFLAITLGIRQTIQGDFYALDPGANAHWIFLRAWNGSGFYIELNDSQIEKQLKTNFPLLEEVDGASPPYKSLFIRI